MRHALAQEPWKALLPDASEWLDKVAVTAGAALASGAHHVLAVKGDLENKDVFTINAPKLDQALTKKLLDQAKAVGWRASAGALHLSVDGSSFTLIAQSMTRVGDKQLARQLGLDAARATKELKIQHLALAVGDGLPVTEVLDGYINGLYGNTGFKGTRKRDLARLPAQITLAGADVPPAKITETVEFAKAELLSRFLQDAPANYLTPAKFAEIAKDMSRDVGVTCKVLDKEQMIALGMGLFLSVADGSSNEPKTIVIEIEGKDNSQCVALVGKGITFDSGGISIKPSAGMEEMKYDMSGGAAVLAAAQYMAKVKPPTKVICLIGASENMPGNNAVKPGDMARAMNGKTVEILNTDAEGRLVLADVLHYAITEYKPKLVVDIATLTGAVLMALGCVGAAVMSNDQPTADRILKAGAETGEPLWQLPLWPEMEKETKGDTADLKNIAKPSVKGGSIMGAMFLKEFVGDAKWAHLDIAGTGWNCQATGYPPTGGSAFGLRTLVAACQSFG